MSCQFIKQSHFSPGATNITLLPIFLRNTDLLYVLVYFNGKNFDWSAGLVLVPVASRPSFTYPGLEHLLHLKVVVVLTCGILL